ncbi:MAG: hypothetical protein KAT34_03555 [Candidatus Aminicenantes bacterium]|nr:hypothetical protein [Candidatus Aminicenantes bacterium]
MSKKIEELIAIHNDILNSSAAANPYIEQRIKSRCRERAARPTLIESLNLKLVRTITAYAFLLFILIFANFFLIQSFKNKGNTTALTVPEMAIFTAAVPGSIASAYSDVNLWEK